MTNKVYTLLVGIDRYSPNSNNSVSTLHGCENDIKAIETYLQKQIIGNWTLQPSKKLINEQATRQAIIDGFQHYLTQADSEDIALFYYSGHGGQEKAPAESGHLEPDGLNETLVCYDSRTSGNYDLADKELRYLLAKVAEKNPRVIVILDCCHSGSGTRNIPQGVRLAPEDTRERDLSSFIFAEDETFSNLLLTSKKADKKNTGLELPKGRHILLAACRDYQYAQEYRGDDGAIRGAFSYFLLKSLEQTNGSLSYLDLARNIEALIRGNVREQVPQLETANPEDLKELFLGDAIADRSFHFTLSYGNQIWTIDGGAIHGMTQPSKDENTLLAIFPVGSQTDDFKQESNILAEAKITKVLTQKSQVEITQGLASLDQNNSYWAVVTSSPIEALKVYLEGEATRVVLAKKGIERANFGNKSLYLLQVDSPLDADVRLKVENKQYLILQDERPLVAPINDLQEAIEALEAIARWRNILNLKSPQRSQIKTQDVEIELQLIGYEGEDGEITITNTDEDLDITAASKLRLEYKYESGEWKKPVIQINLLNHSYQKLYANVINLAEDYTVVPILYEDGTEIRSSVALPAKTAAAGIFANDPIRLSIPEEFLDQGITEYKDVLKLIVSKTDFNASLLEQEGLEPLNRGKRSVASSSSLDRLMDGIYSRKMKPFGRIYDDWIAKGIAVTTIKPRDTEQLQVEQIDNSLDQI